MSSPRPPGEEPPDEPIAELRRLGVTPSPRFVERVQGRIERRELGSQLLWITWTLPGAVLLEFLDLLFGLIGGDRADPGGSS